jgi:hypothetical protein
MPMKDHQRKQGERQGDHKHANHDEGDQLAYTKLEQLVWMIPTFRSLSAGIAASS